MDETKNMKFSAADDEQLVEIVAGHPILWNMAEKDFKNILKKELIWKEIAGLMNSTDKHCKARWKSIRDHYKRQMKAEKNMTTGSAAPSKKRAVYWKSLIFLDTVEDERGTFSNANLQPVHDSDIQNFSGDDLENEIDRPTENIPEQPTKKKEEGIKRSAEPSCSKQQEKRYRKDYDVVRLLKSREEERNETLKRIDKLMIPEHADEIDLFFQSMAATVKKFNPRMKAQAKIKVLNLITQMEIQSHDEAADVQHVATFNYDSSYSASTSAHSPFNNEHTEMAQLMQL